VGPVLIAILVVVAIIVVGGIVSYNRFVQQKNLIKDAWANIDTELRRRYDLIPNLVETVRGYATHEREVFENVTRARAAATGATGSPGEQAAAEGPLVAALRQLFAVVENYPDLKANQNFLALQSELSNTEDRLQTARRFYNANVREYNQRVQSFPSMIVARMFTFREEEFFEVDEALRGDAGVPKVDFTGAAPGVSFGDGAAPAPASPASPAPATEPPPATPRPASPTPSPPASGSGSSSGPSAPPAPSAPDTSTPRREGSPPPPPPTS
jgi:LemA protein